MKNIIIGLLVVITFVGCQKNNFNSSNNSTLKDINISADSIGIIHNQGLDYITTEYTSPSSTISAVFSDINSLQRSFFQSKGYTPEDLSIEIRNLVSDGDAIDWLNDMYIEEKISISYNLKEHLIDILEFIYDGESNPFNRNDFFAFLDSEYYDASSNLSAGELDQLAHHIAVAKSSFDYWFYSNGEPRDLYKSASRGPVNWWEVLGVDCIGGVFGGACGYLGASAADLFVQIIDE